MTARRDVIIAEYNYRHEAEFAAGFLEDAGIPHRLEADDAGGIDAGVTMSRPARLWVRREDADEARELLEITPEAMTTVEDDEAPAKGLFIEGSNSGTALEASAERLPGRPADPARLCVAERVVGVTLGALLIALGIGAEEMLSAGPAGPAWVLVIFVFGVALVVSGLVGRTWGPLRAFLRAVSGVAP